MGEIPQLTILGVGFLLGMRHALDADHVAAVSTILSEHPDFRASGRIGLSWGMGHTVVLFLIAILLLLFQIRIPSWLAQVFEFGVGLMLIILGASLIRTLLRHQWHLHAHQHGTEQHVHLHSHFRQPDHEHSHRMSHVLRSFMIGMVHGLAGSSGLLLVALSSVNGPVATLSFVFLFGLGSILGMLLMGMVISLPLLASRAFSRKAFVVLQGAICMGSVGLGTTIMVRIALDARFF